MWVSQRLRSKKTEETAEAELGVTTIGGAHSGVYVRGEMREVPVCSPGGMLWQPRSGDQVVVLKGGAGGEEEYILGVQPKEKTGIQDGEVYLYTEKASVWLHRDGRIDLNGSLFINGEPYKPCHCDEIV